jgi:hypothetical protein
MKREFLQNARYIFTIVALFHKVDSSYHNLTIYTKIFTVTFYLPVKTQTRCKYVCILLDIGLSNCSPFRSTFGYSHPAPASRPSQITETRSLRLPKRGLHYRTRLLQRLWVLRQLWPAYYHFSVHIRCAMSVTLGLCRITSFQILPRRKAPSIALSIDLELVDVP